MLTLCMTCYIFAIIGIVGAVEVIIHRGVGLCAKKVGENKAKVPDFGDL